MSDEANIVGKGHEILLPPQGNPFDRSKGGEPMAKTKAAPADELRDLSPADIAARFAGPGPAPTGVVGDELMDLTPEDIAARFPTHHDDRNKIPGVADDEPVSPPISPQPPVIASAPPRRIGKMDEGMVEPPVPALEPMATAEAPLPDIVADAVATTTAFDPSATAVDDKPIASTESPTPDAVADVAATMPASEPPSMPAMAEPTALVQPEVAPMAPPERMTMADITPTSPNDAGVLPPTPAPETVAPSAPVVGFKPLNPFAATPAPAPQFGIAQPDASADDLDDLERTGDAARISTGGYAMPPVAEDQGMVDKLITDDRVEQLWQRIDAAEKLAIKDTNSLSSQRQANLENLKAARNLLLGGKKNFEDAQRYLVEVESDLVYAGQVRRWSYGYGIPVLLYQVAWIVALFAGLFYASKVVALVTGIPSLDEAARYSIWVTVLAGGLGGATKALYSLGTHISDQDFDRQHIMWYLESPLLGAGLGIFVFMIAQVGIVALSAGGGSGNSGYFVYILGWVIGFQQNLVFKLVGKVKDMILGPDEKKEKLTPPPQASPPSEDTAPKP